MEVDTREILRFEIHKSTVAGTFVPSRAECGEWNSRRASREGRGLGAGLESAEITAADGGPLSPRGRFIAQSLKRAIRCFLPAREPGRADRLPSWPRGAVIERLASSVR